MEILNFYEKSRTALAHLDKNETEAAYTIIKKLLTAFQGNALIWYLMGRYYEQKKDIFHSIDSYTRALHADPAFLSAAEKLLQLNKDNYSVGELKYLYSLITVYKEGSEEMYRFLQKFKNTPADADLTVPDLDQDRLSADELPGVDDNAYIQHLIRGMDKIEEDRAKRSAQEPTEKKETPSKNNDQPGNDIPGDFQPPPKQAPPPNNNEKLSRLSSYGIETMTMAQMYIRQGLYENAMEILLKLQKRDPSSERIENEISRVRDLIAQEKRKKMNKERLKRLRALLKKNDIDAMLVRSPSNLRYISGYSGSNGLAYITREKAWFFTDFRYKTQAAEEVRYMQVFVPQKKDLYAAMQDCNCIKPGTRIGFEGNRLSYAEYNKLTELFPGAVYRDMSMLLEKLASVKDQEELDHIREAARITDAAFNELLNEIKPGISERRLDATLSFIMKTLGSEKDSFDTIVASGINGAKPHHKTSGKKLQKNEFVTIDFGAMYKGYHADVTRTVCIGKASDKQRKIYDIVLEAQFKALEELRAGRSGKTIDAVARDHIASKGYGEYFGHGLGHGLGLEVHAEPRLSPKYEETLMKDQVVTVEPGIYIPGWGGVRIEDNVIIGENGCTNITTANKKLIEL